MERSPDNDTGQDSGPNGQYSVSESDVIKTQLAVWRYKVEATPELLEAYAIWRSRISDRAQRVNPNQSSP